ncbi:MAG: SDR family NAD(P)-dependent oxidoreductase [Bacteroidales bacterium]|nr:SDR family NAD(P)-dependent oxidoreductase [Bacteroidales bacterium]
MKYFFITGTSRGTGKALAKTLLIKNNVKVIGISRNCTISNTNYEHLYLDLSKVSDVSEFSFPEFSDAEEIVLINNAGVMSEIKRIGQQKNKNIINDYNVNIVSPSILTNSFIKKYQNYTNKRIILNISSGAGRHTIDAWSVYCASKSALDMFSENINVEQSFFPEKNRIKIFSVAPGVIETSMQEQIRNTSEKFFSEVKKFLNLKNEGQLSSPEETAKKLLYITENPDNFKDVILDVRKF